MNTKEINKNLTAELIGQGADLSKLFQNKERTWTDELDMTKDNKLRATYNNCCLIWENHKAFNGFILKYNEFLRQIEINGEPITDFWRAKIRNMFDRYGGFRSKQVTDDFIDEYSYNAKYNPVIDYLNNIRDKKNDSIKCKDVFIKWFDIDYNNEKEKEIIQKLSEKWFVSAIKRIFEPGCFIEGMIVLVGKTGVGKSTFIQRLSKGYCVEASFNIEDEKKSAETLNRCWICNFDEFKSLAKKDPETVKEYLTNTTVTTRLAFRHDAEDFPRHNVFISSTNDGYILKDYTGNQERRFWPLKCKITSKKNIFDNFTDDIVDAIWADALSIYEQDNNYNISISDFNDDDIIEFIKMQKEFKTYMNDDAMDLVREILNRKYKLNNGEFNTLEDFKKQLNEPVSNAKDQIKRIPISWINIVLQTLYHTSRKNDKIAAAMSDEWKYCKGITTAGNCMCFIRFGTEDIFDRL